VQEREQLLLQLTIADFIMFFRWQWLIWVNSIASLTLAISVSVSFPIQLVYGCRPKALAQKQLNCWEATFQLVPHLGSALQSRHLFDEYFTVKGDRSWKRFLNPVIVRSVDFPIPFAPIKAISFPACKFKLRFSIIVVVALKYNQCLDLMLWVYCYNNHVRGFF
jgi:hypothetical protein